MTENATEIGNFRQYSGEPNRREDLEAFGLVKVGSHSDVRTATISVAGREREIRVTPSISIDQSGEVVTILRPAKADFRSAVREAGMSLRALNYPKRP